MTLAKARANTSANAKHIYNTSVNYDRHLRSSKYFYSTGHRSPCKEDTSRVEHIAHTPENVTLGFKKIFK